MRPSRLKRDALTDGVYPALRGHIPKISLAKIGKISFLTNICSFFIPVVLVPFHKQNLL